VENAQQKERHAACLGGWKYFRLADYRGNKFHGIAKTDVVFNFRAGKARLQPIGKSSY